MEEEKFVEICVGIGMDQLTPEYVKIPIEEPKKTKSTKPEIEIEKEK
jgi:hypothetical protein